MDQNKQEQNALIDKAIVWMLGEPRKSATTNSSRSPIREHSTQFVPNEHKNYGRPIGNNQMGTRPSTTRHTHERFEPPLQSEHQINGELMDDARSDSESTELAHNMQLSENTPYSFDPATGEEINLGTDMIEVLVGMPMNNEDECLLDSDYANILEVGDNSMRTDTALSLSDNCEPSSQSGSSANQFNLVPTEYVTVEDIESFNNTLTFNSYCVDNCYLSNNSKSCLNDSSETIFSPEILVNGCITLDKGYSETEVEVTYEEGRKSGSSDNIVSTFSSDELVEIEDKGSDKTNVDVIIEDNNSPNLLKSNSLKIFYEMNAQLFASDIEETANTSDKSVLTFNNKAYDNTESVEDMPKLVEVTKIPPVTKIYDHPPVLTPQITATKKDALPKTSLVGVVHPFNRANTATRSQSFSDAAVSRQLPSNQTKLETIEDDSLKQNHVRRRVMTRGSQQTSLNVLVKNYSPDVQKKQGVSQNYQRKSYNPTENEKNPVDEKLIYSKHSQKVIENNLFFTGNAKSDENKSNIHRYGADYETCDKKKNLGGVNSMKVTFSSMPDLSLSSDDEKEPVNKPIQGKLNPKTNVSSSRKFTGPISRSQQRLDLSEKIPPIRNKTRINTIKKILPLGKLKYDVKQDDLAVKFHQTEEKLNKVKLGKHSRITNAQAISSVNPPVNHISISTSESFKKDKNTMSDSVVQHKSRTRISNRKNLVKDILFIEHDYSATKDDFQSRKTKLLPSMGKRISDRSSSAGNENRSLNQDSVNHQFISSIFSKDFGSQNVIVERINGYETPMSRTLSSKDQCSSTFNSFQAAESPLNAFDTDSSILSYIDNSTDTVSKETVLSFSDLDLYNDINDLKNTEHFGKLATAPNSNPSNIVINEDIQDVSEVLSEVVLNKEDLATGHVSEKDEDGANDIPLPPSATSMDKSEITIANLGNNSNPLGVSCTPQIIRLPKALSKSKPITKRSYKRAAKSKTLIPNIETITHNMPEYDPLFPPILGARQGVVSCSDVSRDSSSISSCSMNGPIQRPLNLELSSPTDSIDSNMNLSLLHPEVLISISTRPIAICTNSNNSDDFISPNAGLPKPVYSFPVTRIGDESDANERVLQPNNSHSVTETSVPGSIQVNSDLTITEMAHRNNNAELSLPSDLSITELIGTSETIDSMSEISIPSELSVTAINNSTLERSVPTDIISSDLSIFEISNSAKKQSSSVSVITTNEVSIPIPSHETQYTPIAPATNELSVNIPIPTQNIISPVERSQKPKRPSGSKIEYIASNLRLSKQNANNDPLNLVVNKNKITSNKIQTRKTAGEGSVSVINKLQVKEMENCAPTKAPEIPFEFRNEHSSSDLSSKVLSIHNDIVVIDPACNDKSLLLDENRYRKDVFNFEASTEVLSVAVEEIFEDNVSLLQAPIDLSTGLRDNNVQDKETIDNESVTGLVDAEVPNNTFGGSISMENTTHRIQNIEEQLLVDPKGQNVETAGDKAFIIKKNEAQSKEIVEMKKKEIIIEKEPLIVTSQIKLGEEFKNIQNIVEQGTLDITVSLKNKAHMIKNVEDQYSVHQDEQNLEITDEALILTKNKAKNIEVADIMKHGVIEEEPLNIISQVVIDEVIENKELLAEQEASNVLSTSVETKTQMIQYIEGVSTSDVSNKITGNLETKKTMEESFEPIGEVVQMSRNSDEISAINDLQNPIENTEIVGTDSFTSEKVRLKSMGNILEESPMTNILQKDVMKIANIGILSQHSVTDEKMMDIVNTPPQNESVIEKILKNKEVAINSSIKSVSANHLQSKITGNGEIKTTQVSNGTNNREDIVVGLDLDKLKENIPFSVENLSQSQKIVEPTKKNSTQMALNKISNEISSTSNSIQNRVGSGPKIKISKDRKVGKFCSLIYRPKLKTNCEKRKYVQKRLSKQLSLCEYRKRNKNQIENIYNSVTTASLVENYDNSLESLDGQQPILMLSNKCVLIDGEKSGTENKECTVTVNKDNHALVEDNKMPIEEDPLLKTKTIQLKTPLDKKSKAPVKRITKIKTRKQIQPLKKNSDTYSSKSEIFAKNLSNKEIFSKHSEDKVPAIIPRISNIVKRNKTHPICTMESKSTPDNKSLPNELKTTMNVLDSHSVSKQLPPLIKMENNMMEKLNNCILSSVTEPTSLFDKSFNGFKSMEGGITLGKLENSAGKEIVCKVYKDGTKSLKCSNMPSNIKLPPKDQPIPKINKIVRRDKCLLDSPDSSYITFHKSSRSDNIISHNKFLTREMSKLESGIVSLTSAESITDKANLFQLSSNNASNSVSSRLPDEGMSRTNLSKSKTLSGHKTFVKGLVNTDVVSLTPLTKEHIKPVSLAFSSKIANDTSITIDTGAANMTSSLEPLISTMQCVEPLQQPDILAKEAEGRAALPTEIPLLSDNLQKNTTITQLLSNNDITKAKNSSNGNVCSHSSNAPNEHVGEVMISNKEESNHDLYNKELTNKRKSTLKNCDVTTTLKALTTDLDNSANYLIKPSTNVQQNSIASTASTSKNILKLNKYTRPMLPTTRSLRSRTFLEKLPKSTIYSDEQFRKDDESFPIALTTELSLVDQCINKSRINKYSKKLKTDKCVDGSSTNSVRGGSSNSKRKLGETSNVLSRASSNKVSSVKFVEKEINNDITNIYHQDKQSNSERLSLEKVKSAIDSAQTLLSGKEVWREGEQRSSSPLEILTEGTPKDGIDINNPKLTSATIDSVDSKIYISKNTENVLKCIQDTHQVLTDKLSDTNHKDALHNIPKNQDTIHVELPSVLTNVEEPDGKLSPAVQVGVEASSECNVVIEEEPSSEKPVQEELTSAGTTNDVLSLIPKDQDHTYEGQHEMEQSLPIPEDKNTVEVDQYTELLVETEPFSLCEVEGERSHTDGKLSPAVQVGVEASSECNVAIEVEPSSEKPVQEELTSAGTTNDVLSLIPKDQDHTYEGQHEMEQSLPIPEDKNTVEVDQSTELLVETEPFSLCEVEGERSHTDGKLSPAVQVGVEPSSECSVAIEVDPSTQYPLQEELTSAGTTNDVLSLIPKDQDHTYESQHEIEQSLPIPEDKNTVNVDQSTELLVETEPFSLCEVEGERSHTDGKLSPAVQVGVEASSECNVVIEEEPSSEKPVQEELTSAGTTNDVLSLIPKDQDHTYEGQHEMEQSLPIPEDKNTVEVDQSTELLVETKTFSLCEVEGERSHTDGKLSPAVQVGVEASSECNVAIEVEPSSEKPVQEELTSAGTTNDVLSLIPKDQDHTYEGQHEMEQSLPIPEDKNTVEVDQSTELLVETEPFSLCEVEGERSHTDGKLSPAVQVGVEPSSECSVAIEVDPSTQYPLQEELTSAGTTNDVLSLIPKDQDHTYESQHEIEQSLPIPEDKNTVNVDQSTELLVETEPFSLCEVEGERSHTDGKLSPAVQVGVEASSECNVVIEEEPSSEKPVQEELTSAGTTNDVLSLIPKDQDHTYEGQHEMEQSLPIPEDKNTVEVDQYTELLVETEPFSLCEVEGERSHTDGKLSPAVQVGVEASSECNVAIEVEPSSEKPVQEELTSADTTNDVLSLIPKDQDHTYEGQHEMEQSLPIPEDKNTVEVDQSTELLVETEPFSLCEVEGERSHTDGKLSPAVQVGVEPSSECSVAIEVDPSTQYPLQEELTSAGTTNDVLSLIPKDQDHTYESQHEIEQSLPIPEDKNTVNVDQSTELLVETEPFSLCEVEGERSHTDGKLSPAVQVGVEASSECNVVIEEEPSSEKPVQEELTSAGTTNDVLSLIPKDQDHTYEGQHEMEQSLPIPEDKNTVEVDQSTELLVETEPFSLCEVEGEHSHTDGKLSPAVQVGVEASSECNVAIEVEPSSEKPVQEELTSAGTTNDVLSLIPKDQDHTYEGQHELEQSLPIPEDKNTVEVDQSTELLVETEPFSLCEVEGERSHTVGKLSPAVQVGVEPSSECSVAIEVDPSTQYPLQEELTSAGTTNDVLSLIPKDQDHTYESQHEIEQSLPIPEDKNTVNVDQSTELLVETEPFSLCEVEGERSHTDGKLPPAVQVGVEASSECNVVIEEEPSSEKPVQEELTSAGTTNDVLSLIPKDQDHTYEGQHEMEQSLPIPEDKNTVEVDQSTELLVETKTFSLCEVEGERSHTDGKLSPAVQVGVEASSECNVAIEVEPSSEKPVQEELTSAGTTNDVLSLIPKDQDHTYEGQHEMEQSLPIPEDKNTVEVDQSTELLVETEPFSLCEVEGERSHTDGKLSPAVQVGVEPSSECSVAIEVDPSTQYPLQEELTSAGTTNDVLSLIPKDQDHTYESQHEMEQSLPIPEDKNTVNVDQSTELLVETEPFSLCEVEGERSHTDGKLSPAVQVGVEASSDCNVVIEEEPSSEKPVQEELTSAGTTNDVLSLIPKDQDHTYEGQHEMEQSLPIPEDKNTVEVDQSTELLVETEPFSLCEVEGEHSHTDGKLSPAVQVGVEASSECNVAIEVEPSSEKPVQEELTSAGTTNDVLSLIPKDQDHTYEGQHEMEQSLPIPEDKNTVEVDQSTELLVETEPFSLCEVEGERSHTDGKLSPAVQVGVEPSSECSVAIEVDPSTQYPLQEELTSAGTTNDVLSLIPKDQDHTYESQHEIEQSLPIPEDKNTVNVDQSTELLVETEPFSLCEVEGERSHTDGKLSPAVQVGVEASSECNVVIEEEPSSEKPVQEELTSAGTTNDVLSLIPKDQDHTYEGQHEMEQSLPIPEDMNTVNVDQSTELLVETEPFSLCEVEGERSHTDGKLSPAVQVGVEPSSECSVAIEVDPSTQYPLQEELTSAGTTNDVLSLIPKDQDHTYESQHEIEQSLPIPEDKNTVNVDQSTELLVETEPFSLCEVEGERSHTDGKLSPAVQVGVEASSECNVVIEEEPSSEKPVQEELTSAGTTNDVLSLIPKDQDHTYEGQHEMEQSLPIPEDMNTVNVDQSTELLVETEPFSLCEVEGERSHTDGKLSPAVQVGVEASSECNVAIEEEPSSEKPVQEELTSAGTTNDVLSLIPKDLDEENLLVCTIEKELSDTILEDTLTTEEEPSLFVGAKEPFSAHNVKIRHSFIPDVEGDASSKRAVECYTNNYNIEEQPSATDHLSKSVNSQSASLEKPSLVSVHDACSKRLLDPAILKNLPASQTNSCSLNLNRIECSSEHVIGTENSVSVRKSVDEVNEIILGSGDESCSFDTNFIELDISYRYSRICYRPKYSPRRAKSKPEKESYKNEEMQEECVISINRRSTTNNTIVSGSCQNSFKRKFKSKSVIHQLKRSPRTKNNVFAVPHKQSVKGNFNFVNKTISPEIRNATSVNLYDNLTSVIRSDDDLKHPLTNSIRKLSKRKQIDSEVEEPRTKRPTRNTLSEDRLKIKMQSMQNTEPHYSKSDDSSRVSSNTHKSQQSLNYETNTNSKLHIRKLMRKCGVVIERVPSQVYRALCSNGFINVEVMDSYKALYCKKTRRDIRRSPSPSVSKSDEDELQQRVIKNWKRRAQRLQRTKLQKTNENSILSENISFETNLKINNETALDVNKNSEFGKLHCPKISNDSISKSSNQNVDLFKTSKEDVFNRSIKQFEPNSESLETSQVDVPSDKSIKQSKPNSKLFNTSQEDVPSDKSIKQSKPNSKLSKTSQVDVSPNRSIKRSKPNSESFKTSQEDVPPDKSIKRYKPNSESLKTSQVDVPSDKSIKQSKLNSKLSNTSQEDVPTNRTIKRSKPNLESSTKLITSQEDVPSDESIKRYKPNSESLKTSKEDVFNRSIKQSKSNSESLKTSQVDVPSDESIKQSKSNSESLITSQEDVPSDESIKRYIPNSESLKTSMEDVFNRSIKQSKSNSESLKTSQVDVPSDKSVKQSKPNSELLKTSQEDVPSNGPIIQSNSEFCELHNLNISNDSTIKSSDDHNIELAVSQENVPSIRSRIQDDPRSTIKWSLIKTTSSSLFKGSWDTNKENNTNLYDDKFNKFFNENKEYDLDDDSEDFLGFLPCLAHGISYDSSSNCQCTCSQVDTSGLFYNNYETKLKLLGLVSPSHLMLPCPHNSLMPPPSNQTDDHGYLEDPLPSPSNCDSDVELSGEMSDNSQSSSQLSFPSENNEDEEERCIPRKRRKVEWLCHSGGGPCPPECRLRRVPIWESWDIPFSEPSDPVEVKTAEQPQAEENEMFSPVYDHPLEDINQPGPSGLNRNLHREESPLEDPNVCSGRATCRCFDCEDLDENYGR